MVRGAFTVLALALAALLAVEAAVAAADLAARPRDAVFAVEAALLVVEAALVLFAIPLLLAARAGRPAAPPELADDALAAVDLFVPVRDEDARVLAATLAGASKLDYPASRLAVWILDDSTTEAARRDVDRVARETGARVLRRAEGRGLKAGALNAALARTQAPIVAVLDVDHVPDPSFLRRAAAGLAADPGAACVQTRIAWRNADAPLRRLAALLQSHFYGVIQWDRGARGRAVFAGSAAAFRRAALEDARGFPEATLVEDFDLTVILATRGWRIAYDDRVGATGLLPWTGRDLARQLWRWSHGTTRVLRLRAGAILRSDLPAREKAELIAAAGAYVAGGLFVLAGLLLAAHAALGTATPAHAVVPLVMLAPASVLVAHVATARIALAREGRRDAALLLPYHFVSLAFTPILFASTLAALAGLGPRDAGRVGKARDGPRARQPAFLAVAAGAAAFGVALALLAFPLIPASRSAWPWALELAAAFLLPLGLWMPTRS
ncbi:MAG TPA: glycosyltransferase [Candidatus Thermoplasmatota archaeon]|nr:glycosyltransferase [Candidatus Thermoplasmatota archaeon]